MKTLGLKPVEPLQGAALVRRALGQLGELGCRYLGPTDRQQLEALARVKLALGRAARLNLIRYRKWLPGRLEGGAARALVERVFILEVELAWWSMPRGEREDLQRLAVVKLAALEQGWVTPLPSERP